MNILIVESNEALGWIWRRHLERPGHEVKLVHRQDDAIEVLRRGVIDVIVLDIVLADGGALAVSDFASYRRPSAKVIFVTNTTFFADGSIFGLAPNARAYVQSSTPPEDLAMMVEHYGSPDV